jgi:hypothetical protein
MDANSVMVVAITNAHDVDLTQPTHPSSITNTQDSTHALKHVQLATMLKMKAISVMHVKLLV